MLKYSDLLQFGLHQKMAFKFLSSLNVNLLRGCFHFFLWNRQILKPCLHMCHPIWGLQWDLQAHLPVAIFAQFVGSLPTTRVRGVECGFVHIVARLYTMTLDVWSLLPNKIIGLLSPSLVACACKMDLKETELRKLQLKFVFLCLVKFYIYKLFTLIWIHDWLAHPQKDSLRIIFLYPTMDYGFCVSSRQKILSWCPTKQISGPS